MLHAGEEGFSNTSDFHLTKEDLAEKQEQFSRLAKQIKELKEKE